MLPLFLDYHHYVKPIKKRCISTLKKAILLALLLLEIIPQLLRVDDAINQFILLQLKIQKYCFPSRQCNQFRYIIDSFSSQLKQQTDVVSYHI